MTHSTLRRSQIGAHSKRAALLGMTLLVCVALAASAVYAAVPGEVNYQGLLLDDLGAPIAGPSDFDFRLFDVESGGTALWAESHAAVSVIDGVYDVVLGSITPIPTILLSGGTLYLEVAVDTETLSPRQRLLAVPYALRAGVAEVAVTTTNVGAIDVAFFEAILVAAPWDGAAPGNFDPSEGLTDTDGDGLPNFMDPDNDADGLSDELEISSGTDINLKTPSVESVMPAAVRDDLPSTLTISGTNFEASMTVQVGTEVGVVSNVTPTSADVALGVHPTGAPEDILVTRVNGQSDTLVGGVQFFVFTPTVSSISPTSVAPITPANITVTGTNFEAGMTVQIGAEIGVLSNLTPTSVDVAIDNSHTPGFESVTVTLANGASDTLVDALVIPEDRVIFVTSTPHQGNFGGIAAADSICNARATAGGLTGTYQAWISDGVVSPATRSTQLAGGAYLTTNGQVIATSWATLTDGNLDTPIDEDENGVNVGSVASWTNTNSLGGGTTGANHCSGWTSTSGNGAQGYTGFTTSLWSIAGTGVCSDAKHLYCIEQ